jgi:tRNA threonylcarbamoyl adenosine modification protein (Sua5/YciO/YrdC/YwlC family)
MKKSFFIHPTDLMYGIGCDATNNNLVMKLRLLKHWQSHPFNIIAPSKEWIRQHVDLPEDALDHLPGPVTIVARLKNLDAVAQEVHLGTGIIGIRMPKHWITTVVARLGKPIVSTCANKRAETLMTHIEQGHPDLMDACAVILHEGVKSGQRAAFIDYSETTILTE